MQKEKHLSHLSPAEIHLLEITEQLVYAMEEAGADLIELGIPFSDPTAEGPVIQEANVRALSGGVTTDKIL